ncbi:DUF3693 domain-containing protein [Rheinheimera sp.]|uniref:DUF3693 domain-containing protein n=1 Tax=Rheinheimera sp. TaxID=1869214 RepID=UPI00307D60FB
MNYSYELVQEYKKVAGIGSDTVASKAIPKLSQGRLSDIKSGKHWLTEEQAVWIAEQCQLNIQEVLVRLSAETAKTEQGKTAWAELAKKLFGHGLALVFAVGLSISPNQNTGKLVFLRRSRNIA